MDLLLVIALVLFLLEAIDWPWKTAGQKNLVRVILIISLYLFWHYGFD
ncbi:MAG: hypothetical protein QHH02_00825 [Syntrophomonadaceae bacterium]|nr:hypothetical protein [Syntrophomonadaceae bacterium]